jgi:PIN domain nuclease of toxin-antitoxin system
VGLDGHADGRPVRSPAAPFVILLDTNAIIWIETGSSRTRGLATSGKRLYISPASLLELQFLYESGRIRLLGRTVTEVAQRGPWLLDDPPAASWFEEAVGVAWTRDPFDRLLVAHAQLRGWRFATADVTLLDRLPENMRLEL